MTLKNMLQWSLFIVLFGAWAHPLLAVKLQRMCIGRPFGTLLPNPLDCNSYYVCEADMQLVYCDRGLHFDRINKVCNWPRLAKCRLDELQTDAPTEELSTSKGEETASLEDKSNHTDLKEKDVIESVEHVEQSDEKGERNFQKSSNEEEISGNSDNFSTEMVIEENSSHVEEEHAETTADDLLNKTKNETVQLEIAGLSDLITLNNSKPAFNSSQTINVPVQIATGLLELKALNNSKPPSNTSQLLEEEVEISTELLDLNVSNSSSPPSNSNQTVQVSIKIRPEFPELKASNNSKPPSNTSQLLEEEVEVSTELLDLKVSNSSSPLSNSNQTVQVPIKIRPEFSELKASNNSSPPSNYSQDVKVQVDITVEILELKSSNSSSPSSNASLVMQEEVEVGTEYLDLKVSNSSRPSSTSNQDVKVLIDFAINPSELKTSNSSRPPSNSSQALNVLVAVPAGLIDLKDLNNTKAAPHDFKPSKNFTQLKTIEEGVTLTSNVDDFMEDQDAAEKEESSEPTNVQSSEESIKSSEISNNKNSELPMSEVKQSLFKPSKNQAEVVDLGMKVSNSEASNEIASVPLPVKKVEAHKSSSQGIELTSGGLPIDVTTLKVLPQGQITVEKLQNSGSPEELSHVIEINNTDFTDNTLVQGQIVVEKVETSSSKHRPNQVIEVNNAGTLVDLSESTNAMPQGLIAVEKIEASRPKQGSSHVIDITNADLPLSSSTAVDASSIAKGETVVTQQSYPNSKLSGVVVEHLKGGGSPVFVSNAVEFSRPTPKSPAKKKTKRPGKKQFIPFEFSDSEEDSVSESDEFMKDSKAKRPTHFLKKKQTQKKQIMDSAESDNSEEAYSVEEIKHSKHSIKKKHTQKQKEIDKSESWEGDSLEERDSQSSEEGDISAQDPDEDATQPSHQKKKAKKKKPSKKPSQALSGESADENNDVSADVSEQSEEYVTNYERPHSHRQQNIKKKHKASKKPVKTSPDELGWNESSEEDKSSLNTSQSSEEAFIKPNSHKHQRHPKKTNKKVNQIINSNESDESTEIYTRKPTKPVTFTFQSNILKVKSPEKANPGKQASVVFLPQPANLGLENFQSNVVKVDSPVVVKPAKQAAVQFIGQPVDMILDTFQSNVVKIDEPAKVNSVKQASSVFLGQPVDMTLDTFQSNAVKVNSTSKPNAVKVVTLESPGNPIFLPAQDFQNNAVKVNSSDQNQKATGNVIEIQSPSAASSFINNLSESGPNTLSAVSTQPSEKPESEQSNLSVSILSVVSVRNDDPVNSMINRPIVGAHNPETGHPIEVLTGYNVNHVQCIHEGLYFLPHPSDCQKYFICAYRHLHLHSCGSGLIWSYKREQCELLSEGRCFSRETKVVSDKPEKVIKPTRDDSAVSSIPVSTLSEASTPMPPLRTTEIAKETERQSNPLPRCPTFTQVYLPNMDDCNKYYICILGQPVLTSCPDNLLWDARGEFCGKESEVTCAGK